MCNCKYASKGQQTYCSSHVQGQIRKVEDHDSRQLWKGIFWIGCTKGIRLDTLRRYSG